MLGKGRAVKMLLYVQQEKEMIQKSRKNRHTSRARSCGVHLKTITVSIKACLLVPV